MASRTPHGTDRPPHPAAQRGVATRERLIHAAVQLIPELGWGAVTTRKVAARAGVQPGVVHYHFASVTDLLIDAAIQFSREALAAPMAVLDAAPDLASGLDRLLAAVDDLATDNGTARLLTESVLAATREERLRTQLRDLLADVRADFATWLRRHGHDTDVDATAAVLAATLDGLLLHRAVDIAPAAEAARGPLLRLLNVPAATSRKEM